MAELELFCVEPNTIHFSLTWFVFLDFCCDHVRKKILERGAYSVAKNR